MKKIISYNVNGIRAALKKGMAGWLENEKPFIICFQETKAHPGQIDQKVFNELGYYQYWFSAVKKGYSSVGLLSIEKPNNIEFGMGNPKFDIEGRLIKADFKSFTIVTAYFPSGTTGDIRQDYKMEFLDEFYYYINKLKKTTENLIICGDVNICHKDIDINHPERHKGVSGFLPKEKEWVSKLLNSGFIDTFRVFNNEPNHYTWWSYRAGSRKKNLGWRIDYHFVSKPLLPNLKSSKILNQAEHSDHCPIALEINI